MFLARQKFEIVMHEVAFVDEILLNNLLKYVFFRSNQGRYSTPSAL